MASFTDTPYKFSPYISTQPVEAMVKVGMAKQQQYDDNVQKIQSWIDSTAALPVSRDVDKQYLQSALNSAGDEISKLGNADFAEQQLTSSIGGMIGKISKDPNIQSAVQSTMRHQKEYEFMQEARKKGELTPENEYNYSKQWNGYLNSTELGQTFNGKYTPYFDVNKFLRESFDAIEPDGFRFDQVYMTDKKGDPIVDKDGNFIASPIMTRLEMEGRAPEKVKQTLDQLLSDGRVSQQLQITGEYNYRGVPSEGLSSMIDGQRKEQLGNINEGISVLTAKKNLASSTEEREAIQRQIDGLTSKSVEVENTYSNLKGAALTNPDYIRGKLYTDFSRNNYLKMYTTQKEKREVLASPLAEYNFKLQHEANELTKWSQEFAFDKQKHADDMKWKEADYNQKFELAALSALKGGKGQLTPTSPELADQSAMIDVIANSDAAYENAAKGYKESSDLFIYSMGFNTNKNEQEIKRMMDKSLISREQAITTLLDKAAREKGEDPSAFRSRWETQANSWLNTKGINNVDKPLADGYRVYLSKKKDFITESGIKERIDKQTEGAVKEDVLKKLDQSDIKPQTVQLYGKKYDLSKEDIYDLAKYVKGYESVFGAVDEEVRRVGKAAEARLKSRGKGEVAEAILRTFGSSAGMTGKGGPLTLAARALSSPLQNTKDMFMYSTGIKDDTPFNIDKTAIKKAFDLINNPEYEEVLKTKSDIIKKNRNIEPAVKQGLLTGNTEADKQLVAELRRFAGAYQTGSKQNMSGDFEGFYKSLENKDLSLDANIAKDANGNPAVEVVSYSDGKRVAGMTIQTDEARTLTIDVDGIYQPKEVMDIRNTINFNNKKQTSIEDPAEVSTYQKGDAWYNTHDFPGIKNSPYEVKANIKFQNGLYYPYIYVREGNGQPKVKSLPGGADLNKVVSTLKTQITPSFVQLALTQK